MEKPALTLAQRPAIKSFLMAMTWGFAWLCMATSLAQGITGSNNSSVLSGPRFLPAEQAFNFYTSIPEPRVLKLHWKIAPGYYLYKDKFALRAISNGESVTLPLQLPEAIAHSDEFFGDVQVYFKEIVAQVSLHDLNPQTDYTLVLEYQGCAEAGFCYTLQQQQLPVVF